MLYFTGPIFPNNLIPLIQVGHLVLIIGEREFLKVLFKSVQLVALSSKAIFVLQRNSLERVNRLEILILRINVLIVCSPRRQTAKFEYCLNFSIKWFHTLHRNCQVGSITFCFWLNLELI